MNNFKKYYVSFASNCRIYFSSKNEAMKSIRVHNRGLFNSEKLHKEDIKTY